MSDEQDLLAFLAGSAGGPPATLVVLAHPDDETIGLGGQLARLASRAHLLQVTDGAPRDMGDARRHGFETRQAYADARRRELVCALALAGIGPERTSAFGIADQEAALDLAALTRRLLELVRWLGFPQLVVPAYEGGHPDHDAVAFAAQAARALLRRSGQAELGVFEFPLYHAGPEGMVSCRFLPDGEPELALPLGGAALERKRRMVACFVTQRDVLAPFPLAVERFRRAAELDLLRPPQQGRLHYEALGFGMDGERWRRLAARALGELELLPLEAGEAGS